MWAIFFHVTFNLHATWLVNGHTYVGSDGYDSRRFEKQLAGRSDLWEGWRNGMHPTSARRTRLVRIVQLGGGIRVMQFYAAGKRRQAGQRPSQAGS